MKKTISMLTAAAALLVLAAPAGAVGTAGAAAAGPVVYRTTLKPDWHGAGEYDGVLMLTIGDDGIVGGYFRQDGSARRSIVTGGLDGKRLWLSLGQAGLSHLEGTFDGRDIVAGTYLLGQNYTFTATPQNS